MSAPVCRAGTGLACRRPMRAARVRASGSPPLSRFTHEPDDEASCAAQTEVRCGRPARDLNALEGSRRPSDAPRGLQPRRRRARRWAGASSASPPARRSSPARRRPAARRQRRDARQRDRQRPRDPDRLTHPRRRRDRQRHDRGPEPRSRPAWAINRAVSAAPKAKWRAAHLTTFDERHTKGLPITSKKDLALLTEGRQAAPPGRAVRLRTAVCTGLTDRSHIWGRSRWLLAGLGQSACLRRGLSTVFLRHEAECPKVQ